MDRVTRTTWLIAISFCTAAGLLCALQIILMMFDHGHSLLRIVFYQLLVWYGWLPATFFVRWLLSKQPLVPPSRMSVLCHLLAANAIAFVHAGFWTLMLDLVQPYDAMTPTTLGRFFFRTIFDQLPTELLVYGIVVASMLAADFYGKYRDRDLRAAQLETSLAEAKLHALELQLQPHFLFNTLNSISSLVRSARNDEAVAMIAGLSDLLRYSLDHAGDQRVSVGQETAILRRYLDIQRTRFADRLTFDIEVDQEAERAAVPMLILQPLAENAIRHGVSRSASAGRVDVRVRRDGEKLRIRMFNTGNLGNTRAEGIGLRNTAARLRQLYGDAQKFELRSETGGVVAELEIPWSEVA